MDSFFFQRAMNEKVPADYVGGSLGDSDMSSIIASDLSSNFGSFQEDYLKEPAYPDTSPGAADIELESQRWQIEEIQSQTEKKKILPEDHFYDSASFFGELVRLRGCLDYHVPNRKTQNPMEQL